MTDSETEPRTVTVGPRRSSELLGALARRPYALLALLCLLLWLPGIASLPALDRDESRFAQSSRQMLESGDFIDIRFGHVPRYKKPVGIYWLQAATTAAAAPVVGDFHIWTYRLASLLGAILAVWLTVWCACGLVGEVGAGPEAAFLAGALMAGTVLLTAEATIATTDAVLLAAILGMQGVLLRVYRAAREAEAPQPSTALVLAGWAAMAAGILVKGPVAPAIAAVTLISLCLWDWWEHRLGEAGTGSMSCRVTQENWRWLWRFKPLPGLLVLLVIVLPWHIAIALASHGAFFQQSLGGDFAAKIVGAQESHGAPPGYFVILSALTFWPTILFVAPAIAAAIARRATPGIRVLLAWAGASWLMFELVPTKLPHYVLPAYPALAILAALWLCGPREAARGERAARWVAAIQFFIGAAALAAASVLLPRLYGTGLVWWLAAAAGAGGLCALAALVLFARQARGWAVAVALVAAVILIPTLTAGAGPRLDRLWITTRLAAQAAGAARPGDPPPVLAGYEEPSMLFALGADIALSDGAGAADISAARGGLALVEARERGPFLAQLTEQQSDATAQGVVSGFNYSRWRPVAVTIYRVTRVDGGAAPSP